VQNPRSVRRRFLLLLLLLLLLLVVLLSFHQNLSHLPAQEGRSKPPSKPAMPQSPKRQYSDVVRYGRSERGRGSQHAWGGGGRTQDYAVCKQCSAWIWSDRLPSVDFLCHCGGKYPRAGGKPAADAQRGGKPAAAEGEGASDGGSFDCMLANIHGMLAKMAASCPEERREAFSGWMVGAPAAAVAAPAAVTWKEAQGKHKALTAKASKLRGAASAATAELKAAEATAERLRAKLQQIEVDLLETEEGEARALAVVKQLTDEHFAATAQPAADAELLRAQSLQAKAAMDAAAALLADLHARTAAANEAAEAARRCADSTDRRLQAANAAAQGEAEAKRVEVVADVVMGAGAAGTQQQAERERSRSRTRTAANAATETEEAPPQL
jgi:hypothetical protein